MGSTLKSLVLGNFSASIFYYLISDLYVRVRLSFGNISTESGTIHQSMPVEDSVSYIETVFSDYKKYCSVDRFEGAVAEIGPGDNCGVGLLFLNDGCSKVDLVDRFFSVRDSAGQSRIYEALLGKYPGLSQHASGSNLTDSSFGAIRRHYGPTAAAEKFFSTNTGYRYIVSRAVLEHLYDPISALRSMSDSLCNGGYLLHKVDLRDHGMFSTQHHELKFLEVWDIIYPYLTYATGRPNRVLVDRYRTALSELSLDAEILVTRLVGVGEIEPHVPYELIPLPVRSRAIDYVERVRSQFASSFAGVSNEDLSISGIFIVAKKI